MNSPRIETPPSLPPGEDGEGVSATSETLCEAVHIIERGMAGPLLACRRRRGGDATVIATLPNPPAEIIDAYSRKLSSESMKTAQAPEEKRCRWSHFAVIFRRTRCLNHSRAF